MYNLHDANDASDARDALDLYYAGTTHARDARSGSAIVGIHRSVVDDLTCLVWLRNTAIAPLMHSLPVAILDEAHARPRVGSDVWDGRARVKSV